MIDIRYIFMAGSVVSSLGKGIVAASLGRLLQARGCKVTIQRLDPYINIDPGTLNPCEHGGCYVTGNGHEADLDLGYYGRFLNIHTSREGSITTGCIYQGMINRERHGDYPDRAVQAVPHIMDEIKRSIRRLGMEHHCDLVITEIDGAVGDIELLPFPESIRQLKWGLKNHCIYVRLTYAPFIAAAREYKTELTQHSVKQLQKKGTQPDILVLRTEYKLNNEILDKVALFCNVSKESVSQGIDMSSIYEILLLLQEQGLDWQAIQQAGLEVGEIPRLEDWRDFVHRMESATKGLHIALVNKHIELQDAYKPIDEALPQSCAYHDRKLKLTSIHSESITKDNVEKLLNGYDGIVVVPGFNSRGVEGRLITLGHIHTYQVPTLGICLGMQYMAIEFARNVLDLEDCNTTKIEPIVANKIIDLTDEQKAVPDLGASMWLDAYGCELKEGSKLAEAYGKLLISERHRHHYEFSNQYRTAFEEAGFKCVGTSPEMGLVETLELEGHP